MTTNTAIKPAVSVISAPRFLWTNFNTVARKYKPPFWELDSANAEFAITVHQNAARFNPSMDGISETRAQPQDERGRKRIAPGGSDSTPMQFLICHTHFEKR